MKVTSKFPGLGSQGSRGYVSGGIVGVEPFLHTLVNNGRQDAGSRG